jgi:hypothetical protein
MGAAGSGNSETRISHLEIKFSKNYGAGHTSVLISILPKAGTRTPGSYLPGATKPSKHMLKPGIRRTGV